MVRFWFGEGSMTAVPIRACSDDRGVFETGVEERERRRIYGDPAELESGA
jgi:hypothetical protein